MKRALISTSLLLAATSAACEPTPPPAAPHPASSPTATAQTPHGEFLADLQAVRHPKDGAGRAWLVEGPSHVQVHSLGTWVFAFEAGPEGLDEGGAVYFMSAPFWDWSPPQSELPAQRGYTTAEPWTPLEGGDPLVLTAEPTGTNLLPIKVTGRSLAPGERLRITYGAGTSGAVADRYAEREAPFWFAVDGDGDGVRSVIADSPTIEIHAGPPAQLMLHLPATARPGETVRVVAALLDSSGNHSPDFTGELLIAGDKRWPGLPKRITMAAAAHGLVHFEFTLQADAPAGVVRIGAAAVSDNKGPRPLKALSNPMLISAAAPRLLWADLHGHSNLSDGTGTPEDYYDYARDVAGLDVVALTDHDHFGVRFLDAPENSELWERIKRTAREHNEPGRFTSLLAFEWTSWLYGHRHVVYFEDDGELISSIDEATDDPSELWAQLRGKPALTFTHHSAGAPIPTDWSFAPDPELEPVTEITSVHGTSEAMDAPLRIRGAVPGNFVRDVLDSGQQLGFIGSGDGHDGHPGLAHLASGTGGLAGIFSEDNTRAGVRAALKARACFATNGPRMLLIAKLAGMPMGSEILAANLKPESVLDLQLFGTAPITRLEVIRSGRVVASFDAAALEQAADLPPDVARAFTLESAALKDLKPGEYVYLRARQQGPGLAWSSAWFIR